jgi:hypothetical protein
MLNNGLALHLLGARLLIVPTFPRAIASVHSWSESAALASMPGKKPRGLPPNRRKASTRGPIEARQTGRPRRLRRAAINAFLIFHLIAIVGWSIPLANPLAEASKSFVRPYMIWSGLFQSWDMFSPAPKAVNSYLEAIVLYRDGNTRIWKFPRMEQLGLMDRYLRERYRKFAENLQEDKNASLWPDAARFIATRNNDRPVPVRMVFLVRYWSEITHRADGTFAAAPWEAHVFYSLPVKPEDFR